MSGWSGAAPAMAQDTAPADEAAASAGDAIVVTGSRILTPAERDRAERDWVERDRAEREARMAQREARMAHREARLVRRYSSQGETSYVTIE